MCGERSPKLIAIYQRVGSSPRVRGTPSLRSVPRSIRRFIPACAGNAFGQSTPLPGIAVHPRVCGERALSFATSACSTGSSPRVRGTPLWANHNDSVGRFIPACAGNAPANCLARPSSPVHPRVCGERSDDAFGNRNSLGSSPRVRGTRQGSLDNRQRCRFIPACAGNASRSCLTSFLSTGSSPRVRGTHS